MSFLEGFRGFGERSGGMAASKIEVLSWEGVSSGGFLLVFIVLLRSCGRWVYCGL